MGRNRERIRKRKSQGMKKRVTKGYGGILWVRISLVYLVKFKRSSRTSTFAAREIAMGLNVWQTDQLIEEKRNVYFYL